MLGDQLGKLPDQPREFLDLVSQRLRDRNRFVRHGLHPALDRAEAAAEFRDLAGEIARAPGDARHLVADFGTVAPAARDGVVNRQHGENPERDQGRIDQTEAKTQKQHRADRAGDEHHACRDKNGADAHHADPAIAFGTTAPRAQLKASRSVTQVSPARNRIVPRPDQCPQTLPCRKYAAARNAITSPHG